MARSLKVLMLAVTVMSGAVGPAVPVAAGTQTEAEVLPYGTGDWDSETFGNHRVVLHVEAPADAVRVRIPWRRRDADPEKRALIVTDAADRVIDNVVRVAINREVGELAFEPITGPGRYHVYYLPWETEGRSNYPTVTYPAPRDTADPAWRSAHGVDDAGLAAGGASSLPEARAIEVQSINEFHSFYPMEVIATAAETDTLLAAHPDATYLLFPEDRRYPVRLARDLPLRWIEAERGRGVQGEAARGEWFAFQVAVWAARAPIEDLELAFDPLVVSSGGYTGGAVIPPTALRCINVGGIDWKGNEFRKQVAIAEGHVQPLWCGVQVAEDQRAGTYRGRMTVTPEGMAVTEVPIVITVSTDAIAAAGDDEPWRHSRLRWLDSTIALDDEVIAPYEPVRVKGRSVSILGREIRIGRNGLPRSIKSRFAPEMTRLAEASRDILAGPVAFEVEGADGRPVEWTAGSATPRPRASGLATWETMNTAGPLSVSIRAAAEFDGTLEFEVGLTADVDTPVSDVRLRVPIARDVARYMMGMGHKGGHRPESFDWSWDVERNQDGAWLGDVNAGLQFSMRDERYERPLNTNFYQQKPLIMPRSWANDGRGGCRMREVGDAFEVTCFSGERVVRAGETLRYDFRLLVTPFHTLDTDRQWRTRFFHRFRSLDEIEQAGANTVNVHHATEINPFINYPFMRPEAMKAYVDDAHARSMKVKIYYTVRELSNIAPELFALLSLGDEVLSYGPGGGYSWLQEHVERGYIGGWFVPPLEDAAIVNSGASRWHNYYLEGLDWLARNVGIDGLYIDDVAFDRTVMKRVRKILDRHRPGALIDLHSANQFNPRDGFANSANLYLEHFPFLDRLWFGEYFDYDSQPDLWMVEVAGIPFGLMGEMLQDGGNPWRGMLYGMTNRLPWSEDADPRPIWKAWDAFGMQGSRMIGYWVAGGPVTTSGPKVLATSYLQEGRALIALASWADEAVEVGLRIDWEQLGIDPGGATIRAHPIQGFQRAASFEVGEAVPVEPGRGWLLSIEAGE